MLYTEPSHKVRKYDHGIKDVAAPASKLKPGFNPRHQFSQVIDHLETHYRHRYPDAPDFKHDASTAELVGIDELVLHIYEALPIPDVPKFHTYGYFLFVCCPRFAPLEPFKEWLERGECLAERSAGFLATTVSGRRRRLNVLKNLTVRVAQPAFRNMKSV